MSSDGLVIVSGIDRAPQAVRLMLVDSESLEILKKGDTDIFSETDVLIHKGSIYAVLRENDSWFVGKFNMDMELQVKSSSEVLSYSPLQMNDNTLYVQLSDGKVVALDPETMKIE